MPRKTQEDEANDFLMGGGGVSFSFAEVGDTVTGTILSIGLSQQSDFKSKEPLFWDEEKTRPKNQVRVTLQTDLTDWEGVSEEKIEDLEEKGEEDDGIRNVYLRWKSAEAAKKAVRAAGAKKLMVGGKLRLKFSGEEKKKGQGYPTKLYEARYRPPVEEVDEDDLDSAGAEPEERPRARKAPAKKATRRRPEPEPELDEDDLDTEDDEDEVDEEPPARSARARKKAPAKKATRRRARDEDDEEDDDDPGF
jgi:hypothetical protein